MQLFSITVNQLSIKRSSNILSVRVKRRVLKTTSYCGGVEHVGGVRIFMGRGRKLAAGKNPDDTTVNSYYEHDKTVGRLVAIVIVVAQ